MLSLFIICLEQFQPLKQNFLSLINAASERPVSFYVSE